MHYECHVISTSPNSMIGGRRPHEYSFVYTVFGPLLSSTTSHMSDISAPPPPPPPPSLSLYSLFLLGTSSDGERSAWMEAMKGAAAPKPADEKAKK